MTASPTLMLGGSRGEVTAVRQVMVESGGTPLRIGFVTPRYGNGVVGGSEAVIAEAARGFARRGHEVDVLTTTARSHVTWANEFSPGTETDDLLTIRRFRTVSDQRRLQAAELERRVQHGDHLTAFEEIAWVNGRFSAPDLYLYLLAEAPSYDALVFSPYLFWSTLYGTDVAPERSIVMPCLHDEPYARLGIVRSMLEAVAGLWFLSEPEHLLAHRIAPGLSPHHRVVGAAVEVPDGYDPRGFRERFDIEKPFVLYAGRREEGKGWRQLLGDYAAVLAREEIPFDLVTIGVGAANVPDGLRERVHDLGLLDYEDVPNAFAAADALLQPSANESFSRIMIEAWLAGTPVIASSAGEVVTWHCERSSAGLTYADEIEFGECLRLIAESPKTAEMLGERGRAYVLENYTWDIVLDAMEDSMYSVVRAR